MECIFVTFIISSWWCSHLPCNWACHICFNGCISRSASPLTSMVMCPDHPGITYNLSLVRNEPTYNQPIQQWTFVSDFAVSRHFVLPVWIFLHLILTKQSFPSQVRDYSGTYTLKLIPCTSPPNLEYNIPPVCNPREPLTFDMDIRFQQVTPPRLKLDREKQDLFIELCEGKLQFESYWDTNTLLKKEIAF